MNPSLFTAFLLITAVLIVAPGPIVTLVISTGATQGVRAALTTVAGTTVGNVLLLATIAVGLNWVVAHAGLLFEALRWTGAAYLVWLGVQAWRNAGRAGHGLEDSGRRRFLRGLVVALSQSEDDRILHRLPTPVRRSQAFQPDRNLRRCAPPPQLMAAVTDSAWAIAAGLGRGWLMKPQRAKLLRRLTGSVLIGGGIWLTLARRPS